MALCKSVITSIITKLVQKESPQEMAVYLLFVVERGVIHIRVVLR